MSAEIIPQKLCGRTGMLTFKIVLRSFKIILSQTNHVGVAKNKILFGATTQLGDWMIRLKKRLITLKRPQCR